MLSIIIITVGFCFNSVLASNRQIICKIEESLCGQKCYDPKEEFCHSSEHNNVCKNLQKICADSECYSSETQICVDNEVVCLKSDSTCKSNGRTTCYDPTSHHCIEDEWVCPIGKNSCPGNSNCYTPDQEFCFEWNICSNDQKTCGHQCYSPKLGQECYNDTLICPTGEIPCGLFSCYKLGTEVCFDDGVWMNVCPLGSEWCDHSSCYWPHNETCYENRSFESSIVCSNGMRPCGHTCYDPLLLKCHRYGQGQEFQFEAVCPLGNEYVGMCEGKCYDTSIQKCVEEFLVCNVGDEICGRTCYNPLQYPDSSCYNEEWLCPGGQVGCGEDCYNPNTHQCLEWIAPMDFMTFLETLYRIVPVPAIIIGVIGIFGNMMSIVVLTRKEMKSPSSVVLISLSMFDTLLIVNLEVWYVVSFSGSDDATITENLETVPYFMILALMRTAYTGSVYTTVLLTVERFVVICWPMHALRNITIKRAKYSVGFVALFSIILNSPRFFERLVRGEEEESEMQACGIDEDGKKHCFEGDINYSRTYDTFSVYYETVLWIVIMYVIPFLVIAVLNLFIWMKVRVSHLNRSSMTKPSNSRPAGESSSGNSLTRMLLTVVFVFIIANALNCAITLFALAKWGVVTRLTEQISNFPLLINSSVNFFIYCVVGTQFRLQLFKLWTYWFEFGRNLCRIN